MAQKTKKKVVVKKTQPKASRASASKTVAKKVVVKKAVKKVASSRDKSRSATKKTAKKAVALPAGKAGKKTVKKSSTSSATKKMAAKTSKASASKTVTRKIATKASTGSATKTNKWSSKKTKKDEECFLTTACVNYYALTDDAYELTTLRSFRDQYMLQTAEGKTLVKQYYAVAPLIVSLINKDKEHKSVYQYIYRSIQKACSEIELKKYRIAQQTYIALVNTLVKKYAVA